MRLSTASYRILPIRFYNDAQIHVFVMLEIHAALTAGVHTERQSTFTSDTTEHSFSECQNHAAS